MSAFAYTTVTFTSLSNWPSGIIILINILAYLVVLRFSVNFHIALLETRLRFYDFRFGAIV